MILAIDIGEDRKSYGFSLVIHSIIKKFGNIIFWAKKEELDKININNYSVVLLGFMFVLDFTAIAKYYQLLKLSLSNRKQIVIAGGPPVSENPEPIADFFDIAVIGEGEWAILDILDIIFANKFDKNLSLAEIYEKIDCAYVPKFYNIEYDKDNNIVKAEGKKIQIRREDPTKASEIKFLCTRLAQNEKKSIEYSIEYHRGCKRKCSFCSYSHLQGKYRKVEKETFYKNLSDIAMADKRKGNRIVPIQVNLFHYDVEDIEYMQMINKFPNYSSACFADMFSPRGQAILNLFKKKPMYLRFGIEDFTEEGRKRLKKPIPNYMLENFPILLNDNKGRHFKFFFITSLPNQTIEDIKEFETVLENLAKRFTFGNVIDLFFTVLNYKLSTPIVREKKEYKEDIHLYLETKLKRKYGGGKLTIRTYKNQNKTAWEEVNFLSLGNRKLCNLLANPNYKRKEFVDNCKKTYNIDAIFGEYTESQILPNWFISY